MSRILIITGGEVNIASSLQYTKQRKYNKIIAVDGGLKAAYEMGITPDIIIGDFDTVKAALLAEYEKKGCQIKRLNPMKDETDTEAAYLTALKLGAKKIDIIGGTGSRFDHTYANIFLLKRGLKDGIEVKIITRFCRISVIEGDLRLCGDDMYGKYISLIQFDGSARGVTLKGFVYNVENFDFDTDKTYRLGVSNELADREAFIHIEEGCMLLIETKEDKIEGDITA